MAALMMRMSRSWIRTIRYTGTWELPVIGTVTAPAPVLIRPDGHVAWVGAGTQTGLREALTTWFGQPAQKTPHKALRT